MFCPDGLPCAGSVLGNHSQTAQLLPVTNLSLAAGGIYHSDFHSKQCPTKRCNVIPVTDFSPWPRCHLISEPQSLEGDYGSKAQHNPTHTWKSLP